jgi:hypothetical protein
MYHAVKSTFKNLGLLHLIKRHESAIRKCLKPFYYGHKHYCNVCDSHLRKFVRLDHDLLCPICGSRSRGRFLLDFLTSNGLLKGTILHFSPPKGLSQKLKSNDFNYLTSDYLDEFDADYSFDICNIDLPDDSVDGVICFHVLEHIENDIKAIKELDRILKPEGFCLIQTPFKEGEIYEDSTITSPEGRLKAFGQEDHVRIYGASGLKDRLIAVMENRNILLHSIDQNERSGIEKDLFILIS